MGNESSSLVDENTSPSVLEARNIDAVAKYVKEKQVRRVVVMVCCDPPRMKLQQLTKKYIGGRWYQSFSWYP